MVKWAEVYNTYAGDADALDGDIAEALQTLAQSARDGVAASDWQVFLGKHHVSDHLKNAPDARLTEALSQREGRLGADVLTAVIEAVRAESARRRSLHEEAKSRFGIDAGVFAKDDRTLVVELVAPTPYFLDITAFYVACTCCIHIRFAATKRVGSTAAGRRAHKLGRF
jgi:hypothetical protein